MSDLPLHQFPNKTGRTFLSINVMTDYSELEVPDHVSYQDETYDHGSRDDNNGQLDGREGSGASARPWTPIVSMPVALYCAL